jgi:hypothetical protein
MESLGIAIASSSAVGLSYFSYCLWKFGDTAAKFRQDLVTRNKFDSKNDNKPVHVVGELNQILPIKMFKESNQNQPNFIEDTLFNIKVQGLKLTRSVEMFQYYRNGIESRFLQKWSENPESGFLLWLNGYKNPLWTMKADSFKQYVRLDLNGFEIDESILEKLEFQQSYIGVYKENDFKHTQVEYFIQKIGMKSQR